jgi:hypothetical protein
MDYGINTSSIFNEINKVRTQPKIYAKKLETLLKNFEGNILSIPNKKNKLVTLEGINGFKESINFLNSQSPMNKLELDKNLSKAAEAIADQFSKTREMYSINQTTINDIIHRYGQSEGPIGISIDFGNDNIEMLIISLINDDGRKDRRNRKMMFDYNYNKVGCSSKISKFHKNVVVILYAIDFSNDNNYNNRNYAINYVNENVSGLDPRIDLFTDSAKRVDNNYNFKKGNYYETGHNCYNYDYPAGNVYKINKNDPDMKNVKKIEKNERFIFEKGKRIKLVSIKKYMDNGEIKTTIEKFNL